jgi:HsdM N-terminal domain
VGVRLSTCNVIDNTTFDQGPMPHDQDQPAEETLFDAANDLRGSVESATYKHLVLGLVFLKYVSDGFQARRDQLDALGRDPASDWYADDEEDRDATLEDRDAYEARSGRAASPPSAAIEVVDEIDVTDGHFARGPGR